MAQQPQHAAPARRKTSTGRAARIEALIEPTLEAMGYRIVRVLLSGGHGQKRLQIMVERSDGGGMEVDHCAEVSRAAEAILDVEDPISGAYTLEVSSPGIDRPLTRLEDFATWAGFDAKVELAETRDGRKRFRGRLLGLEGEDIRIEVEGQTWQLPFAEIDKAKLIMTDALLAAVNSASDSQAN